MNLSCLILNSVILDPLFLFGFKTGIRGVSLATILSEIIPGFVVFLLYYSCHKFGVKPTFRQFRNRFSPRTWDALNVGVSQLFAQLSVAVPSIVVRKFIGMCDEFSDAMAGFNTCLRIYHIIVAVMNGTKMGLCSCSFLCLCGKTRRTIPLAKFPDVTQKTLLPNVHENLQHIPGKVDLSELSLD